MRITLFVASLVLLNLFASATASAQATTEPLTLTPATAPATAPQKYPDLSQPYSTYPRQGYANNGVTYYNAPAGPAPSTYFDRNELEFSLGGMGYTTHGDHGNDSIGFVTFEVGWYFVPNISLDVQLGLSPGYDHHHDHHHGDDDGLRAEEEMVLVRWHCLNAGPLSLFIDGGAGGLHASPEFPTDGRKDNFMAAAGGGISVQFLPHFYGSLGARAAFLDGGDWDHHHSHHSWSDGVQYYGQLSVIFP